MDASTNYFSSVDETSTDSIMGFTSFDGSSEPTPVSPMSQSFSLLDYSIFIAMLASSALIGVYFAFCAKQKQNTTSEYLMGGKRMGVFPISMSLIASCVSGITLMGMSAEMYTYGTQYATTIFGILIATVICVYCFMPVYCQLNLNTSYEYLELRFDRSVRLLGSALFIVANILYIPIVIYVPALAFSQVSGINVHLITPMVCMVCIFYTSMGGLKAVVWTDALQTVLMFGGMIAVVWIGTNAVGGFGTVLERNEKSGRFEFFIMSPDPTIRHTFWNTVFGSSFNWVTHLSINQGVVQRFLAMPNIRSARIMIVAFNFGVNLIYAISLYAGLLMYASYHNCDLVSVKAIKSADQILPYFVMNVANTIPGLPGLFMAGVFSAALSSMSTGLNSMAGVLYEDFIEPFLKVKISEERASLLMKIVSVVFGVICVGMVFIVENLGAVVQVSWSLSGVTLGPLTSCFVLGMFFPWANAKGTLIGGISGMIVMGFICFGTQASIARGQIQFEKKPFTIDGCSSILQMDNFTLAEVMNSSINILPTLTESASEGPPFRIFYLSYTLYTLFGLVISTAIGLVASALTGFTDLSDLDIILLSPVMRPLFASRCKGGNQKVRRKVPESVEVIKEKGEAHNLLSNNQT